MPRETNGSRHPAPDVIDQRQQQIDPAGKNRVDQNDRPDSNRKQPGGSDPANAERDGAEEGAIAPKQPKGGGSPPLSVPSA